MTQPLSRLQAKLDAGEFVVTGEIGPPKGTNIEKCIDNAVEHLKDSVTAVNVTDIQTAVMRVGALSISHLLIDKGIEPVFQMVTRDRNRLALQSDLLSAYVLGIRNVLALTGDHVALGDHPSAKPVYDLDSVGLLQAISTLEAGSDLGRDSKGNPNKLDGAPSFFKGACVTPCAQEVEPQIIKLEKKVEAGAQFIQTQAVYDPAQFERFMRRVERLRVPVLVGILVLKSPAMARYVNNYVPGVDVPEWIINRLGEVDKEDRQKASVEICGELISKMKHCCQGAHLMTLGWERCTADIRQAAGI